MGADQLDYMGGGIHHYLQWYSALSIVGCGNPANIKFQ